MEMKIDVNSIIPANVYSITNKNVAAIQSTPAVQQDKIEISGDAKMFSDAMRTAMSSIRDRIETPEKDLTALQNKIANDEYHVNSSDLAKSMLMDK
jgi:hypothetical protein